MSPLYHCICNNFCDKIYGPYCIVIPRYGVVYHSGISIGIHNCHYRNSQLFCLFKSNILLNNIHDVDKIRKRCHVFNSAKNFFQLLQLFQHLHLLFFGIFIESPILFHSFKVFHVFNPRPYGIEIGKCTSRPPLHHVKDTGSFRFLFHSILALLFSTHKKNLTTLRAHITNLCISNLQKFNGFPQIDNMNFVSFSKDKRLHLGIPASAFVAKMHTCFQKVLNRHR